MKLLKLFLLFLIILTPKILFGQETDNSALIKKLKESVVIVRQYGKGGVYSGLGTGFFIAPNIIITNHHVISGATKIDIKTSSGEVFDIKGVVAESYEADLVKLELATSRKFTAIPINTDKPKQGNKIIVIGNPVGIEFTASEGIVSVLRYDEPPSRQLQYTAAISHGNSGSPILDLKGEVIGTVTSIDYRGQSLNLGVLSEQFSLLHEHEPQSIEVWVAAQEKRMLETPEGLLTKAEEKYNDQEFESAAFFSEFALSKNPKMHRGWYLLALCNERLRNFDQSVHCIDRAIEQDSTELSYLYYSGLILWEAGRYQEAIVAFKRIIFIEPDKSSLVSCKLAGVLSDAGRKREAIEVLGKAISLVPMANLYGSLGAIYRSQEDFEKAIEAFNHGIAISYIEDEKAELLYQIGLCYFEQKKYSQTEDYFEQANALSSNIFFLRLDLGKVYYSDGKYERAVSHLLWCCDRDSTDFDAIYYFGLVNLALGKKDVALSYFAKANSLENKSYTSLLHLAIAQRESGDYKNALPNFRRAMKIDPTNYSAYTNLSTLYVKVGNLDEAIELANEAYQITPTQDTVLITLVEAYSAKEDYVSAFKYASIAESLYPKEPNIILQVGKCAIKLKNNKLALQKYELLKKINAAKAAEELFNLIYGK